MGDVLEGLDTVRQEILDRARGLEERGFVVVPVHSVGPDGKTCSCPKGGNCKSNAGKHPIGDDWQGRRSGLELLTELLSRGRKPNLGVLPEPSGVIVVDIDPRNGGATTMAELVAKYGRMPKTRLVSTGSDGWHYYFKAPENARLRGTLGPGVDLKYNGMVIVEGSRSHSGEYALHSDAEIAETPAWILEEAARPEAERTQVVDKPKAIVDPNDTDLPRRQAYATSAIASDIKRLTDMEAAKTANPADYKGEEWNNTLFKVACNVFEFANTPEAGLDAAEAEQLLLDSSPRDKDFGDAEILKVIGSARDKVGSTARAYPAPPVDPFAAGVVDPDDDPASDNNKGEDSPSGERHSGQVRMAYRLAAEHGSKLMHVYGLGWHYWTGTHWAEDHMGKAHQAVLKTLRKALVESVGDKELRQDVTKCESAAGINGVLSIAANLPTFAYGAESLDADEFLLNTPSGTWDFRSRTLRPNDPGDRLTKVTSASIVDNPDSAAWDAFLDQVLPDVEVREFLRRALGQGLLGAVLEHTFLILTGTGGNGKGVFYGALTHALGSYGTVIDPSLLMRTDSEKAGGPELLRLRGARTVVGSETAEGRRLDEATMKRLTGGDRLTARNLYKPPVEWTPTHQLVYVTNHLPEVKGNDPAVWRRIRVVPFDVKIPDEEKDPELETKLRDASDAILSWVIKGYYDYRETGLAEPEHVKQATNEYKLSSDAVQRFVNEDCLVSPAASVRARELWSSWQRWAIAEGVDTMSEKALANEMKRLGYTSKRAASGMVWKGVSPLVVEGGAA